MSFRLFLEFRLLSHFSLHYKQILQCCTYMFMGLCFIFSFCCLLHFYLTWSGSYLIHNQTAWILNQMVRNELHGPLSQNSSSTFWLTFILTALINHCKAQDELQPARMSVLQTFLSQCIFSKTATLVTLL